MQNISNTDLTLDLIPCMDADWKAISAFAVQFDGYTQCGSFEACAEISNARRCNTLTELRTCLLFEQRRWRHFDDSPDAESMSHIRSLLEKIRAKVAAHDID